MCVYIEPECAVCVSVMFNNHYNKLGKDNQKLRLI